MTQNETHSFDNQRYNWIDYAKGLGIILVVYAHVVRGLWSADIISKTVFLQTIDTIIYSFHMPLFFVLSGFTFIKSYEKKNVFQFITSKLETIYYPYLLWSFLHLSIKIILSNYTNYPIETSIFYIILYSPQEHFWFLYILMIIFLVTIFLIFIQKKIINRVNIVIPSILSIILYIFYHFTFLPDIIDIFAKNYIYFILGIILYKTNFINIYKISFYKIIFLFILGLCLGVNKYPFSEFLTITSLLILIPKDNFKTFSKFFLIIGKHSLMIYVSHIIIASGIRIILLKVFHIENIFIHIGLGTFLGVFLPTIFSYYLDKYHITFLKRFPRKDLKNA